MVSTSYGIYGASGCGRGVMPLLGSSTQEFDGERLFIDDGCALESVNDFPVLTYHDFLNRPSISKFVTIAIADGQVRRRLAERCAKDGLRFHSVVAREHVRMVDCEVKEGAIFSPYTTLTSNIRIGRHFHCNLYSYVEHDCIIGDYVTFAPGVKCNGNVHIGDQAYIGAGAVLKQGTPEKPLIIGPRAVVGMGAVVTKDVPADSVVAGNPARLLKEN